MSAAELCRVQFECRTGAQHVKITTPEMPDGVRTGTIRVTLEALDGNERRSFEIDVLSPPGELPEDERFHVTGPDYVVKDQTAEYEAWECVLNNAERVEDANWSWTKLHNGEVAEVAEGIVYVVEGRTPSEPGFCSNAGTETASDLDYSFSATANVAEQDFSYDATQKMFIATLYCKDFGGACTVEVSGQFDLGGQTIVVDPTEMPIPVDADNDGMADVWEKAMIQAVGAQAPANFTFNSLTDQWDDDPALAGQPHPGTGDLLWAFDEYRGFMKGFQAPSHTRTNPLVKDVFYMAERGSGVTEVLVLPDVTALRELGYEPHIIPEEVVHTAREINPKSSATTKQKYVRIRYVASLAGFGKTTDDAGNAVAAGTPRTAGNIWICPSKIWSDHSEKENREAYYIQHQKNVVTHEMGHTLYIDHWDFWGGTRHTSKMLGATTAGASCATSVWARHSTQWTYRCISALAIAGSRPSASRKEKTCVHYQ